MSTASMKVTLSKIAPVLEGPETGTDRTQDSELDERSVSAHWFRIASEAFETDKDGAATLGDMDESYYRRIKRGDKPASFDHAVVLLRKKPDAFRRLVQVMAISAGMRVEREPEVDRKELVEAIATDIWASEPLRRLMRRDMATRFGVSEDAIEHSLRSK